MALPCPPVTTAQIPEPTSWWRDIPRPVWLRTHSACKQHLTLFILHACIPSQSIPRLHTNGLLYPIQTAITALDRLLSEERAPYVNRTCPQSTDTPRTTPSPACLMRVYKPSLTSPSDSGLFPLTNPLFFVDSSPRDTRSQALISFTTLNEAAVFSSRSWTRTTNERGLLHTRTRPIPNSRRHRHLAEAGQSQFHSRPGGHHAASRL